MPDLLAVIPKPTPIQLGDSTYLASELRLSDLADLLVFIRSRHLSPLDVAYPFLTSLDRQGPAFRKLLGETLDGQAAYPPGLVSSQANHVLNSKSGFTFLAYVALRREHPQLTLEDLATALETATPDQLARLNRIAWAQDSTQVLMNFIPAMDEPKTGPSPKEIDWGHHWYAYLTKAVNGPGFSDLTLTQFGLIQSEGKTAEAGMLTGDESSFDWARWKALNDFLHPEPSDISTDNEIS